MRDSTADNPIKIAGALANTYGRSLLELAAEANIVDQVADELDQIAQLLGANADLAALFGSSLINPDRRAASVEKIFKGRVSDLTYRFLQVVNAKGRLDQLPSIVLAYHQQLKKQRRQVDVDVYSARPLSDAQLESVRRSVSHAVGAEAIVTARVDESMIGGLKLRVGDRLIDGSVATQLRRLKDRMITQGREAVRSSAGRLLEE